ncbi:hypothetical protein C7974DRAFT_402787 [Boeremia exigua]|uniref:uncharacterized protein n=1 Tax=Boeremia exigua TaxID=749465 RepID=UPI001E8CCBD9|nr:uncharacterized protein C7974DRAFT_402787 [Boeremia exigua]KAH6614857.1 hypothetical protein C7974DRAFT_402787 [Boeremia exigua]
MPSTQTRTKLKAFQLDESLALDPDKENRLDRTATAAATPKTSKVARDIEDAFETPRLPPKRSFPPPSTPGTRLPLSDLVGNTDDTSRHASLAVLSPEEQLFWRGSQPANTPVPRKNRKRAHSSSPVAPSQDDARLSARKPGLTTPQADPATDLWSRYTSKKTPTVTRKSVAFAHLIDESSPRSAAAAGSVNGLRRWASCGVEFPASSKKRRKTHAVFQADHEDDTEDLFAAVPSSDSVMQGHASTTNLASIVKRMKQSISNSQEQPPSSSSPLPENGQPLLGFPESPLKRHSPRQAIDADAFDLPQTDEYMPADDLVTEDQELPEERNESQLLEVEHESSASSDDFGEVDFDTDMAEAVNAGTLATETTSSRVHPSVPVEDAPVPVAAPPVPADSEDDFGIEDDDDVFAADLEQAASFFDDRPLASSAPKAPLEVPSNASAIPVIDLVNDDSDDFGDDIDPDEFAAAEVAATQTPVTNTVCRTRATRNEMYN